MSTLFCCLVIANAKLSCGCQIKRQGTLSGQRILANAATMSHTSAHSPGFSTMGCVFVSLLTRAAQAEASWAIRSQVL